LEASEQDVDDVEEIGPEIARSVHAWFADTANRKLIEKLRSAGVRMRDEAPKRPRGKQPLAGKTIVLTGGPEGLSRDEAGGRGPGPPAPGWRRACRRRRISSSWAKTRARKPRGPRRSASRRSTSGS